MKKYIIFILLLLFITGCEANYSIVITNEGGKESLTLKNNYQDSDLEKKFFETNQSVYYYSGYDAFSEEPKSIKEYYQKTKDSTTNTIEIKYDFPSDNYANSAIVKSCFDVYSHGFNLEFSKIQASDFNCFEKYPNLERVNISVVVPYKIIETNSQYITDKQANWSITKDNYKDFSLELTYTYLDFENDFDSEEIVGGSAEEHNKEDVVFKEKIDQKEYEENYSSSKKTDQEQNKTEKNTTNSSFIVLFLILFLVGSVAIITIIIYIINKKNNRI